MRSLRAATVLLAIAVGCSSAPPAVAPSSPSGPTASAKPSPDRAAFELAPAMEHIRALAVEIGYRPSGSEGDGLAASYIVKTIEALGWRVERRPFPLPQGGKSWNVVGIPPGFDEEAPYLLVGGHYDSLNGPGANDNASGVGVVLELARALDQRPAALPAVVVGFGAEERQPTPARPHHVGSRHFVEQMTPAARTNLVAMLNVDMVSHGDTIICAHMSSGPREGTDRCLSRARELGIAVRERVTPDWSDNGSFLRAGMNAAWVWTGELKCCYHNPRDTMDVVRASDVERTGRLALAILRSYTR